MLMVDVKGTGSICVIFFIKQKTAYEVLRSLVGAEMCIRDSFARIVFGAMLSAIMVAIVSAFVLATARGLDPGFTAQWLKSLSLIHI